jgi:hypothetical protein|tara:strand:- start:326 stop:469 length:144 start_codon:yes stop_codon:yes gene_type:complete
MITLLALILTIYIVYAGVKGAFAQDSFVGFICYLTGIALVLSLLGLI